MQPCMHYNDYWWASLVKEHKGVITENTNPQVLSVQHLVLFLVSSEKPERESSFSKIGGIVCLYIQKKA